MDTKKKRPISNTTSIEANDWKSKDYRNKMVKKIAECFIQRDPLAWSHKVPQLLKSAEKIEEELFDSAKDEAEYMAKISTEMKTIMKTPIQSDDSNLLSSKVSGSETEKETSAELQEQIYQKIQTIKTKYCAKLNALYKGLTRRYEQPVTQLPKSPDMLKCEQHMRALEYAFVLFKANKSKITSDFQQKVEKVERYIRIIEQHKIVTSKSRISQGEETSAEKGEETSAKESTAQVLNIDNSDLTNQFSTSTPQEETDDEILLAYANIVQQQTSEETSPIIGNFGILDPPLLENCSNVNEVFQDPGVTVDETSPAMQRLIKVLTSVSAEALVASCGEIDMLFHLNDDISTLEPLNGPPVCAIGSNSEGVFVTDSQARYLTRRKFAPKETKINRVIDAMPTGDNFMQITSSEKHLSDSSFIQENYNISEEIKEINKQLIDTEVVIDKSKLPTAAEGKIIQDEGLTVKLVFNSVTVNINPMSKYDCYKKPLIKPLWLHIPPSYPNCSAVILDEMPSEASSKDLEDLSVKAKLKLRLTLQRMNQPLLLKDIAVSWDHCAREAICEYAELHGGGTFSSKYGEWETCFDSS